MLRRVVLTVTPCSSLYRPEKFTMYSPSVHPLSNQLPSRRTRTNSEGPEAAILPPSAKIPDLVFYYRYFKCLKSLFDRLPSGMIA